MDISRDHTLIAPPRLLPEWHGYSPDAVQWLLAEPYQALEDEGTSNRLVADFSKGGAQIRMKMIGFNAEAHVPDVIYACKYKPDHDALFMIRLDTTTGQPQDVRQVPAEGAVTSFLGPADFTALMQGVFTHFSRWHRESFGVGPVAPSVDPEDPNTLVALESWSQARRDQMELRTQVASGPGTARPRI